MSVITTHSDTLQYLDIRGVNINPHALKLLAECRQLVSLSCDWYWNNVYDPESDVFIAVFGSGLHFVNCSFHLWTMSRDDSFACLISNAKHLTNVDLSKVLVLSDDQLISICAVAQAIRTLNINRSYAGMSLLAAIQLSELLSELVELNFGTCFKRLIQRNNNTTAVDFAVHHLAVKIFAQKFTMVSHINFIDWIIRGATCKFFSVTDCWLLDHAFGRVGTVFDDVHLTGFSEGRSVDNADFMDIKLMFPLFSQHMVQFRGCDFRPVLVEQLHRGHCFENLSSLSLTYGDWCISLMAAEYLANSCKCLQELELNGCSTHFYVWAGFWAGIAWYGLVNFV